MVLELRNIDKSFGEKEVLKGVSFTAEGGKAFGLLGRNGAGKTTSIRIIMNVFPANGGEVLLDGKPIDYNKIGLGYLPEERGLYPKKPVIDQLAYFAELKGMSAKEAVRAVDDWLDRLGMTEYRNKRLDTLSKGNQQKIQLITALAHNPHIVILDEPFSGLDPVNAMLLKDVVKEQIAKGKIVLFSSHQIIPIKKGCHPIKNMVSCILYIFCHLIFIRKHPLPIKISRPGDQIFLIGISPPLSAGSDINCGKIILFALLLHIGSVFLKSSFNLSLL